MKTYQLLDKCARTECFRGEVWQNC